MKEMNITGVTSAIVNHLRIHIVERILLPGQKLNEAEIASRLGISRPPLREAFRILEGEDLVVTVPRKGCYVKQVSIEACRDIFQVREMMECYAVDLIREKKINNFSRVESALHEHVIREVPKGSDPYEKYRYLKTIADFHIQMVESAENFLLNQHYHKSFPALARYQSMYTYINDLMEESKMVHTRILGLIQEQQFEQAKKEIRLHVRGFLSILENQLKQNTEGVGLEERNLHENSKNAPEVNWRVKSGQ
ncbi:MAG: GntR family transcriptional regulator [Planctomycetota bacterium]